MLSLQVPLTWLIEIKSVDDDEEEMTVNDWGVMVSKGISEEENTYHRTIVTNSPINQFDKSLYRHVFKK